MLAALLGGALIGLGAALFWFGNARIAGVTGVLGNALRSRGPEWSVSVSFLAGLACAGFILLPRTGNGPSSSAGLLALAGLLVGFGARLGAGCTSGHGVCGIARASSRSLVATLTFMATGAAVVFVVRHVLNGNGVAP
ncbi:MAG TPA: YeeE/YedE thiosulfate transporter family protein [Polyangiaceae bacterium]|nr:YeeE/YedE thiosulfate transporter family protein [Polyangiaceae bacterium]